MAIANRTGGQILLSMFGKNLTTKAVDVYQLLITTGDPVSFSADALSSGNYDYQTVTGKNGSIIGQVQLDEQDPSGEISCSFYEDFSYLHDDYVYGNSKNLMLNLFNGEAFKNGEEIIVPVGTNGTDKTLTARAKYNEMNKPYKYLLYNEGHFIKEVGTADINNDGKVTMKRNPYESSFNQAHKTICMEFMTTTGDGQVNRMFPIIAKSTLEWVEGDINMFNFTGQRGCDMFERDNFYTEILSEGVPTTAKITELYVDYVVKNGATEPAVAEDNALLASLGADGTVTIKKCTTNNWSEESAINDKIQVGTRIKSRCLIEEGSTEQRVNTFVALGADKKAVDFSMNGSKRYFCKVYDYDTTEKKYVEYLTNE